MGGVIEGDLSGIADYLTARRLLRRTHYDLVHMSELAVALITDLRQSTEEGRPLAHTYLDQTNAQFDSIIPPR